MIGNAPELILHMTIPQYNVYELAYRESLQMCAKCVPTKDHLGLEMKWTLKRVK